MKLRRILGEAVGPLLVAFFAWLLCYPFGGPNWPLFLCSLFAFGVGYIEGRRRSDLKPEADPAPPCEVCGKPATGCCRDYVETPGPLFSTFPHFAPYGPVHVICTEHFRDGREVEAVEAVEAVPDYRLRPTQITIDDPQREEGEGNHQ